MTNIELAKNVSNVTVIGLMKNLFDKDFPSPQPIINNNGNYITEIVIVTR